MLTVLLDEHFCCEPLRRGLELYGHNVELAVDLFGQALPDSALLAWTYLNQAVLVTADLRLAPRHIYRDGSRHGGVLALDMDSLKVDMFTDLADLAATVLEQFEYLGQVATLYRTRSGALELDWGPVSLGELRQRTGPVP